MHGYSVYCWIYFGSFDWRLLSVMWNRSTSGYPKSKEIYHLNDNPLFRKDVLFISFSGYDIIQLQNTMEYVRTIRANLLKGKDAKPRVYGC